MQKSSVVHTSVMSTYIHQGKLPCREEEERSERNYGKKIVCWEVVVMLRFSVTFSLLLDRSILRLGGFDRYGGDETLGLIRIRIRIRIRIYDKRADAVF